MELNKMTPEQFKEFTEEIIPQQLFHVMPTDIDDYSGGKLEEAILVALIAGHLQCLKYKPLQWFLDTYLIKPIIMEKDELERLEYEAREAEENRQAEMEYYMSLEQVEEVLPSTEEKLWADIQRDEREEQR